MQSLWDCDLGGQLFPFQPCATLISDINSCFQGSNQKFTLNHKRFGKSAALSRTDFFLEPHMFDLTMILVLP